MITQLHGDCRALLATLEPASVQTIVTSPPYWRMRRYTDDPAEIGQEPTPAAYVAALVEVFALARRALRDDGTLWLNLGDGYARDPAKGQHKPGQSGAKQARTYDSGNGRAGSYDGLPPKNLIGLPWRVAFGLQDDGWVLRNDIIWHKPNAMPESVKDRCTRDHEYVFWFSKSPRYYADMAAIAEAAALTGGGTRPTPDKAARIGQGSNGKGLTTLRSKDIDTRNARTVWSIPTTPLADAHYAPMPAALAERCIKVGSRPGDLILDPFGGSGTTGRAAVALQRRAVLIDLGYQELQAKRTDGVQVRMVDLEEAS